MEEVEKYFPPVVQEVADEVIKEAKKGGAEYADFRSVRALEEEIRVSDGKPSALDYEKDFGFGVRVLKKGAWGFASSPDFTSPCVRNTVKKAIEIAEASSYLKDRDVKLAPEGIYRDTYKTPYEIDPFSVPLERKLAFLEKLDLDMSKDKKVNSRETFLHFKKEWRYFVSTEGSRILQQIVKSGAGITAMAFGDHHRASRSYPQPSGQYQTIGYEILRKLDFESNIPKVLEDINRLLKAESGPSGEMDLVLDGPLMSLQIHESLAHALEMDRVLGVEESFSGTSYATVDKLGKLRIGSKLLNFYADLSTPFGLATCGYDDEGVKAHRTYLIKEGILTDYLSSREYAALIGHRSTGALFAARWPDLPIIRITNVSLEPGDMTIDELISEIKNGVFIQGISSWSIDDKRLNFRLSGEIGWEIKNGERTGKVFKRPSYSGNTIEFWNSLDGLASKKYWEIWGTPNCGKGEPGQTIGTAQGTSPGRFRKIKLG